MELALLIRQQPIYNKTGQPIFWSGTSPYNLTASVGALPTARQWANYPSFEDVTDEVSDLYKVKISWSIQRDDQGIVVPGSDNVQKGVTGTLSFEGEAYRLLKSWLTEDISAPLNAVEVKIYDSSCGNYEGFTIRPSELQWCEGDICQFTVNIKQQDEQLNCIKRTLITDNHQGWFPIDSGVPANGKKHPRFSYCVEQRPNGTMIMMWWMAGQVLGPLLLITLSFVLALNAMIFAINGLIAVVNLFKGNPINTGMIPFINPQDILDSFTQYYVESAGCGREHPAPLIRDYITNVCDRCGILVDNVTAPIFFAPIMAVETSTRGVLQLENPHYNACYYHPSVRRGIRRNESINIFGSSPQNTTDFWISDNGPIMALDMFLDQIKPVYNAEWRVKNGYLYFQRKDYYLNNNYIYDFTENSADRLKILHGICFEPNELKYPAYCTGLYATDASDMNEAGGANGAGQMNGIVQFGNIDDNPNYEGVLDKTAQFGAVKFNLDGASQCYYYDAMQVVSNGAALSPFLPFQMMSISGKFREFADYAVLMQGEICALPKILIWDGNSFTNAKAVSPKAAASGTATGKPMPNNNPAYNLQSQNWDARHPPITKVTGSSFSVGSSPHGVYKVQDYFGLTISENPALLCNYPMYFEPFYYDTMWDWFHWIDDPARNPVMNMNWSVKIDLCCDDLKLLGVLNNASNIALGERAKLPFGFYQDGVIKEITVSYDPEDVYGMYIELKGTL